MEEQRREEGKCKQDKGRVVPSLELPIAWFAVVSCAFIAS